MPDEGRRSQGKTPPPNGGKKKWGEQLRSTTIAHGCIGMIVKAVYGTAVTPAPAPAPSATSSPPPAKEKDPFAFADVKSIPEPFQKPTEDVWVPLRDVQFPGGVRLAAGDTVRFNLDVERLRALPPIAVIRVSPFGDRPKQSLIQGLDDIAARSHELAITEIPNSAAVIGAIAEDPDIGASTSRALLRVLNAILGAETLRFKADVWLIHLKPLMSHLLAEDGPLLKLRDSLDDLFSFALSVCRRHCGNARSLMPLIQVFIEGGCDARAIAKLFKASHPPNPAEDSLDSFLWPELPIVPTQGELRGLPSATRRGRKRQVPMHKPDEIELLPSVKTHQPYDSTEEYLETYYRLFRADAFMDLSQNLDKLLQDGHFDPRDMAVFGSITLAPDVVEDESKDLNYTIRCQPRSPRCVKLTNLSFGNLLALSLSGRFDDVVWLSLVEGPPREVRQAFRSKLRQGDSAPFISLVVRFCRQANDEDAEIRAITELGRGASAATIVENPVFFTSYEPVLAALRDAHGSSIPFEEQLVHCRPCASEAPDAAALLKVASTEPGVFGSLDPGKSYLGVRVVYSLVRTRHTPILVMSYKNHSLDEFILDIQKLFGPGHENVIVRLGHSPKMDPAVANSTLECARDRAHEAKLIPHSVRHTLREAVQAFNSSLSHVRATVQALGRTIDISYQQFVAVTGQSGREAVERLAKKKGRSEENLDFLLREWAKSGIEDIAKEAKELSKLVDSSEPTQEGEPIPEPEVASVEDEEAKEREREEEERMAAAGAKRRPPIKFDFSRSSEPTVATLALHYNAPTSAITAPRNLPTDTRRKAQLIRAVLLCHYREAVKVFRDACAIHSERQTALRHASLMNNAAVINTTGAVIICCTVVGAAINRDLISLVQPRALVIEEAAEIPEPALISSLFPTLKRIVQVGDHKQLRASIASHDLCEQKKLEVSSFERLVNCRVPFETLSTQNRMAPQLLGPVLLHYPNLDSNHAIIDKLPFPPQWVEKPLFWWSHTEPETLTPDSRSKTNSFEAERAVMLVSFLLRQGFKPESITILTPYVGQLMQIRAKLKRLGSEERALGLDDVPSKTVDEFQGDEAEIVILSLVRSARPGEPPKLGFLTMVNRQIVATSRHKCGLIIIGNDADCSRSSNWRLLIDQLKSQGNIGNELPLSCPRHKKIIRMDRPIRDLFEVTGCGETCNEEMECKHPCKGKCHGPETRHRRCTVLVEVQYEPCKHKIPRECGHKASSRCELQDVIKFPCGHSKEILCWQRETATCTAPCDRNLPCGHRCGLTCPATCSDRPCRQCIDVRLQAIKKSGSLAAIGGGGQATTKKGKKEASSAASVVRHGLSDEKFEALLATVQMFGVKEDDIHFWAVHVLSALRDTDFFFSSFEWSRGTLDEEGRLERLENYERVISIAVSELGIRVPKSWSMMPQVMAAVALSDLMKPGSLENLRAVLVDWFDQFDSDELGSFARDLPQFVRQAHDLVYLFILGREGAKGRGPSRRFGMVHDFRQCPMEAAAERVTAALDAPRTLHLTPDAIELGRSWGLFATPKITQVSPNSIPPAMEVPKQGLYTDENTMGEFVSVDIRRADFTVLRLFNPSLVLKCKTWEEFVATVIDQERKANPHAIPKGMEKLRGIRTRILGKIAHRKNAALQSHVLRMVCRAIVAHVAKKKKEDEEMPHPGITRIFRFSCDELIVCCLPATAGNVLKIVQEAIEAYIPGANEITRTEAFQLHVVPFTEGMMSRLAGTSIGDFDSRELLERGHPALTHEKFQEPPFEIDPQWEDAPDKTPRPDGIFFVRRGLSSISLECKCLSTSLIIEGSVLARRRFSGELFAAHVPAPVVSPPLTPSPFDETGGGPTQPTTPSPETHMEKLGDAPEPAAAQAVASPEQGASGNPSSPPSTLYESPYQSPQKKKLAITRPSPAKSPGPADTDAVKATTPPVQRMQPTQNPAEELRSAMEKIEAGDLDVNTLLPSGFRALGIACKLDWAKEAALLLKIGARPDLLNSKGSAPIHLAAGYGSVQCLRLLLGQGGCDPRMRTRTGMEAEKYAIKNCHPECAEILRLARAQQSHVGAPSATSPFAK